MNRWSVSRLFRKVNSQDFLDAVTCAQASMAEACNGPIELEIKFYNGLKHSITSMQDDLQEWLDAENAAKVFETVTSIDDFTDDAWLKAVFVEAVLRPAIPENAPNYAFGHIEAKGTNARQICFYSQPAAVGSKVMDASLQHFRGWRRGDGYKSNHSVSYS